ncbi:MAG TPA: sigma-70 family RNA polymerase sigma factor [Vicinamibacteria bacterium]|nr:sigma-70 family RNA polymerase sigma factor [Vicinamibacteria bacterium]
MSDPGFGPASLEAPQPPELPASGSGTASDARLAAIRAGEPEAVAAFVRSETPRLLGLARRILRDEEEARDAVQEAFLRAFRSLPAFRGSASLSTWLYKIALNASLMRLRSRRSHPEVSLEELLPRFLEDGHHAVNVHPWLPVDEALGRRELCELVRRHIDRLPEPYRLALLLRDVEELDTEETARALGVSCNVVKVRLHRARQALRGLLDPVLSEAPRRSS